MLSKRFGDAKESCDLMCVCCGTETGSKVFSSRDSVPDVFGWR